MSFRIQDNEIIYRTITDQNDELFIKILPIFFFLFMFAYIMTSNEL